MAKPAKSPPIAAVQPQLPWGVSYEVRESWARQLHILRAIAARVGAKEIAFDCDTSPSQLADALADRDRKAIRAEWYRVFLHHGDEAERAALLRELAEPVGFEVREAEPLTPEEKLRRLEARVRSIGSIGDDLIREAYR